MGDAGEWRKGTGGQGIGAVSCRRRRRWVRIVVTGKAAGTGTGMAVRIGRGWETGTECRAEGVIGERSAAEAGAAAWMKTERAVGSWLERGGCGGQDRERAWNRMRVGGGG